MKFVLLLALLGGIGWVAWQSKDDVERYRRLREMQAVHEFGVAAAVLDAVETRAAGRRLSGLRIHVGALQRLDRSVFDDAFAMIAEGGVADGALVDVVEVPVEVRCRTCATTATGPELITTCDGCGGHDLELLAGDDLVLESISVAAQRRGAGHGDDAVLDAALEVG